MGGNYGVDRCRVDGGGANDRPGNFTLIASWVGTYIPGTQLVRHQQQQQQQRPLARRKSGRALLIGIRNVALIYWCTIIIALLVLLLIYEGAFSVIALPKLCWVQTRATTRPQPMGDGLKLWHCCRCCCCRFLTKILIKIYTWPVYLPLVLI